MIARTEGITYTVLDYFSPSLKSNKYWVVEKNAPRNLAKSAQKCVILDKTLIISRIFVNIEKNKTMRLGKDESNRFPPINLKS